MKTLTTATLLAATFVFPAMAQTTPATPGTDSSAGMTSPATHDTADYGTGSASGHNPVMTKNGGMRTSKIVGSAVYNDQDTKIGSIDDLVIESDHSVHAVLSVGGFLGMDTKLVEVPFSKLHFGTTKGSDDDRVVLPGTTKQQLTSMPTYRFDSHS